MKVTPHRLIPLVLALDIALFAISGISRFKNTHHGADALVGQIVWLGFLAGVLVLIALIVTALKHNRRDGRPNGA